MDKYNINNNGTKQNSTKYEERIVAYVDILGFKDLVNKSKSDSSIYEKIKRSLDTINNVKKESEKFQGFKTQIGDKVSTFSDSIIISYPARDKDPLYSIVIELMYLQGNLLSQGISVRGGIAKGLVRHVGDMCFGPALIDAYELESKYAIYPRIIMEKELVEWQEKKYLEQEYGAQSDINDLRELLKLDEYNDIYYIDVLGRYEEFDYFTDYISFLNTVKKIIINGLSENKTVKKKYIWLKNYYNDVINNLNISNKEQLRISDDITA